MNMDSTNQQQTEDDHQTYRKELFGEEFDYCQEKCDHEKEVDNNDCEGEEQWDDSDNESDIVEKEDCEESEKNSISIGEVDFISNDSQYVSGLSVNLDKTSNTPEDERDCECVENVILKEELEMSEKEEGSLQSLMFTNPTSNFEELLYGTTELKTGFIDNQIECFEEYLCFSSEFESDESGKSIKTDGLRNRLSSLKMYDVTHVTKQCEHWNIQICSFVCINTSSFNESLDSMGYLAASDSSLLSMGDQYFTLSRMKSQGFDGFDPTMFRQPKDLLKVKLTDESKLSDKGESLAVASSGKPRRRSGSNNKSRGRRHRSKKHGNKSGRTGKGGSGSSSGGGDANNGANSMDGNGGSCGGCGGGNEDEDDGEEKGNVERCDEEDEEEDEDSEDDNQKDSHKKKELDEIGNLLPATPTAEDKAMNKDLTPLLSENSPPPHQSTEPEGQFKWQVESESPSSASVVTQQNDEDGSVEDHSCISIDTLCDIIGAASGEDYVPKDDPFLSLNPCLTTLSHNMSVTYDVIDCHHCCFLSELLKHLAKCDTQCSMCSQGFNLILHHTKICIQTKRPLSPCSRMDLCFKLCENVHWDVNGLFDSNKIYNKMMIKKYCNKVLTLPFDQEISDWATSIKDTEDQYTHTMGEEEAVERPIVKQDVKPKLEQACKSVDKDVVQSAGQTALRSGGHHTTLSRKPSNSRRSVIPPPITEHDEEADDDDQKEKEENEKKTDDSAEAVLRRRYGQKADTSPSSYTEREYIYSLPQGRINDQLQFHSLVSEAKGVKGVGEVVYSNVAQIRRIADFWYQKKEEYTKTGKRPYQRAEEGVILENYKDKFQILGTRYQLDYQWHKLASLGSGMTGRCYLAMDKETEFRFCVKKINLVDYKKEELCLWSDLNHPHIVTLYGALRHSAIIYFFTEYIDGGDLAHCIDEHKSQGERLSHWLALKYFQQMLNALMYLESKNLLHEDIKADNLLLRANTFDIVLTDFGLCHRLQKAVEFENKMPAGTPTHFSPEKAASMGHGFPACVWACVCVLVHMLSGQQPWHKYLKKVDYLNFTIYMKPPPLEDVPDNIRTVVKDLIAQGFIKDPEKRPSAHKLLQHGAFNIINQERETYFSTLASAFQSNVGVTARAAGAVGAARDPHDNDEVEVSLYEISLPQSAESKLSSGLAQKANSGNVDKPSRSLKTRFDEGGVLTAGSKGAIGEAAGGDISLEKMEVIESTRSMQKPDMSSATQNLLPKSSNPENGANLGSTEVPVDSQLHQLILEKIPALEMLLQPSDESTLSFLTNTSSTNLNAVPNLPKTLEIYNPNSLSRNSNSVLSDQLPNLSIFEIDPYSWNKHLSSGNSSSGEIDSAEMFASGEAISSHPAKDEKLLHKNDYEKLLSKKPEDLKLNVNPPPLRQQGSQERLTLSKKSSSVSTIGTASSIGSSVFTPGSASSAAARGRDFKDIFGLAKNEEQDENPKEQSKKVRSVIASLRESIDENSLDGLKLTVHAENGEELFPYRMPEKDKHLAVKNHISVFKTKIKHSHFELKTMEGKDIDYNSSLKCLQLMVVAQPEKKNCWCAGCQF